MISKEVGKFFDNSLMGGIEYWGLIDLLVWNLEIPDLHA